MIARPNRGLFLEQFVAFAFAIFGSACSASPSPCITTGDCTSASVCEIGRCAAPTALPASSSNHRIVTPAIDVQLDSSDGTELVAGGTGARHLLLARFDVPLARMKIESAFLLLTPMRDAPVSAAQVELSIARVLEPWASAARTHPRIGPTEARALATFAPPDTVRIDVTTIVRAWATGTEPSYGLAIAASGGDELGARFATGTSGADGPRLDVYTR